MIDCTHSVFTWPVRVYYEDSDAGGVVYHANYLNFMERARTEWLRALGFEQTTVKNTLGIIIVVHSVSISFKSPAYFNDMLKICCEIAKIGYGSMEMTQKITRDGVLLIDAYVRLAFVNTDTFKPVGIPANMKKKMLLEMTG